MSTTPQQPGPDDIDERFRSIIDAEFGPRGVTGPAGPDAARRPRRQPVPEAFNLSRAMDEAVPDEPAERFVPPDPGAPPIPRGRALVGCVLVAGSLAVVLASLLGAVIPPAAGAAAVVAFVVGLGVLLTCLPREPRDPSDDGARV